ncbi:MAG: membrane protein insertase YidC [Candidatus Omnitrophica bacterium]|nr:membrane protein insertase YidC [Candidatus Omnitrophota bacterium]MBL7151025.1 membrane protein insertase YidC [Candidatus Omnitrophota bacterium]MBL7210373.1 membrane protein insertase YidC [Candidatus Omnitrophota bacterium]
MGKRFILALSLSLLVLLAWSALVQKPDPVVNKVVTMGQFTPVIAGTKDAPAQTLPTTAPAEQSLFKYTRGQEELIFIEEKGAIKEVCFNGHQKYIFPLQSGLLIDDASLVFKRTSSPAGEIRFVQSGNNKKIVKDFIGLTGSKYDFWMELKVQNASTDTITVDLPIILGVLDFSTNSLNTRYLGLTIKTTEKSLHSTGRKDVGYENAQFVALRDRYFCLLVEPESKNCSVLIRRLNSKESEIVLSVGKMVLAPGQQLGQKYHIYLGPQDIGIMNSLNPAWSSVINYGFFDFISQILLQLLRLFYGLVHNWGWAIIILSIAVYLILFPLTLKQMRSMKEMQALQPHIEELRKTYKDNPQKLNKEIMGLYKQHKVNPFGGCLPLLLQMPIFFGLYQALMRSVALKGANFLWIKDLSEPDRLFILPNALPILGNEINILPIIMAIGMFFQQKMSMVSAGSSTAGQQKMMVIIFPVMFGFIFYHMPSGLVLYWLINSTLMTAYQFRIRHSK